MSHNILGNMFAGRKEPGWHRIGKVFTEELTATEAAALCGADRVIIGTFPMGVKMPNGEFMPMSDRRVIMRYPIELEISEDEKADASAFVAMNTKTLGNFTRLGECSNDYSVIQNEALVRALDKSGLSQKWKTETIGVLNDGATIFVCLDMGTTQVRHEDHNRYCLVTDTRDGKSGLIIRTCLTRVVCANTLAMALSESEGVNIALSHGSTLSDDFEFSMGLVEQVETQVELVASKLEALSDIRVTTAELPDLVAATYPMPKRGGLLKQYDRVDDPSRIMPAQLDRLQRLSADHAYEIQQTKVLRQAAGDCFERIGREFPVHHETGLGFFNAVSAVACHTRNRGATMPEITGYKAEELTRGYKALLALAK